MNGLNANTSGSRILQSKVRGEYRIDLALEDRATSRDALLAHLHAVSLQVALETQSVTAFETPDSWWQAVEQAYAHAKELEKPFIDGLAASDWHADNLLVEEKSSRYKWLLD